MTGTNPKTPEQRQRFLALFAEFGTVGKACAGSGIARRTINHWRKNDPEFAEQYDDANEEFLDSLRDQIIDMAKNGTMEQLTHQGMLTKDERKQYHTDLIKLLARRLPELKEKIEQEVTHGGGVLMVPAEILSEDGFDEEFNE